MKQEILKTQNYYDGIAKGYKELYHKEQIQKINLVKNYFPKKSKLVLDLGSGDGVLNKFISKDVNLISMDLSFELLKLNSNKNKILANAQKLPFKNNSLDFIFSFTIIQDIDLKMISIVIEEMKRVIKKEGKLILSFIKVSKKIKIIEKEIQKNFKIIGKIEEEKDFIFVLKN